MKIRFQMISAFPAKSKQKSLQASKPLMRLEPFCGVEGDVLELMRNERKDKMILKQAQLSDLNIAVLRHLFTAIIRYHTSIISIWTKNLTKRNRTGEEFMSLHMPIYLFISMTWETSWLWNKPILDSLIGWFSALFKVSH